LLGKNPNQYFLMVLYYHYTFREPENKRFISKLEAML